MADLGNDVSHLGVPDWPDICRCADGGTWPHIHCRWGGHHTHQVTITGEVVPDDWRGPSRHPTNAGGVVVPTKDGDDDG